MKTIFFTSIALFLGILPAWADPSDDGFYTSVAAGYAYSTQDDIKNGYTMQTGFGQKWFDFLRTELNVDFTRVKISGTDAFGGVGISKGGLPSLAVMAVGYVDLFSYKGISPYIGAGAGISRNELKDFVIGNTLLFGDKRFDFAWKAVGGIGIDLPKNFVLDIAYSYADLGRFSTKATPTVAGWVSPVNQDLRVRKILVGLRYNF